ncbi:C1 family peptidase [Planktothrix pseudagardhii]|uniref:Cysteine protease n=1 Tax=Planktothrix pseudagardhii TaxID=132604 RepID=A0A9W4D0W7_9CYAN|nr:C1 family peptidase [Planktothrix pseudagardhii]CAD5929598.1 Cysteine protease [Planktothrix pseudagardhii]
MPLNINPLGWLPDYPDSRDMTLNDMSENIIKENRSQSQDCTELQIVKLIEQLVLDNPEHKKTIENLKQIIKKDQNQIVFLPYQSETKVFLYRRMKNYWIKDIQKKLDLIFENCNQYLDLNPEYLENLPLENGYFGEATHHLMIYFKKIWELPSQSSIVDFDYNSDLKEIKYYQYFPNTTIYGILNTIYQEISQTKNNKSLIQFGNFGEEVFAIKEKLERLNYFTFSQQENYKESKYFYGYKTDLVVEFFQGFNGLQADGIVGKVTLKQLEESEVKKDEKIHKSGITYLQKRLSKDFGSEVKVTGELDDFTKQEINKIIKSSDDSGITMESVKKFLIAIIEKAESSKKYCLSQTVVFSDLAQNYNKNNNHKNSTLLMIEQPISKNIIDIFKKELNFIKPGIKNNDYMIITPIIYPLIQLIIKNLSDMGIHGQLDYEKMIAQAINLINTILASDQNSSLSNPYNSVENYLQDQQLSNDTDQRTQFLFEFIRGKKSGESEVDLKLIYHSLSQVERKRLTFLIFITLDQIESIISEIKEHFFEVTNKIDLKQLITTIKNNKKNILCQLKDMLDNSKLEESDLDFCLEKISNNKTVLRICNQGQENKLQIPLVSELETHIKMYPASIVPVYLCLPEFVDLSHWCSPIRNQEPLNSCTACAAIALVEYFQNRNCDEYTNASVLFLYKVARKLMHRQGDVGASIRETMKAMVLFGIPPEEYWPYEPSKIDEEPSGFCYSYAQNYQTIQYFRLDTPGLPASDLLAQIKMTLVAGIPSMFGLTIYSSIYEEFNYKRGYIPIPNKKDHVEGGHAVVAVGYDDHKIVPNSVDAPNSVGALLIRNSWGTNWGEQGYGWLPYDYILKGLTSDWWSLLKAKWFETKNFGLGANDWKHNDIRGDDKPKQKGK